MLELSPFQNLKPMLTYDPDSSQQSGLCLCASSCTGACFITGIVPMMKMRGFHDICICFHLDAQIKLRKAIESDYFV